MEYDSALKANEPSSYEKTCKNLRCVSKWEKPTWKGCTLCDSYCMTLREKQDYGDRIKIDPRCVERNIERFDLQTIQKLELNTIVMSHM